MASWDIFCSVVDNYGDIGVTWRLARQLAAEHGQAVRLWVDEPQAFARICPRADPAAHVQCLDGVEVRAWGRPWAPVAAADVVIEAFACELPEAHRQAMRERKRPSLWLNLEYLSAEEWIGSCHALSSLQACGLSKYFFFPGFREPSGGLLREAGLLERRRRFQASVSEQDEFLASLGVRRKVGERLISLFAYENPALPGWLEQLRDARQPSLLLVPEGRVLADVADWLRVATLAVGDVHVRDALRVQVLPFMAQDDYDRLLWCCDLNAVRGEDSFVRAQWAGRPLLWHIYRQEEEAHLAKLEAFLELYCAGLPADLAENLRTFWLAWNAGGGLAGAWEGLERQLPEWRREAQRWADEQGMRPDLAARLVQFYADWL
ncbi:TPA: elongation factor P maturation arginine rhamnosyltransferase EarP [Pseudomonas aeruginosa]